LGSGTATRHLHETHPAADGHFPGNPIIPGAVLLREIIAALPGNRACATIRSAKFHYPVRPGDTLVVSWEEATGGEIRFACSITGTDRPAVTGALRMLPP
jgi:3-hydroxymyristoyl/3-hydroxydecanoyl-(acyl carrier protein) dehydratase